MRDPAELPRALEAAAAQASAAFGDGTVYVERWVDAPRHVEVQVFGDGEGGGIHLGERECSVQRRRQKLLEWTPGFGVTPGLRRRLGEAALRLVAASRYRGAGTVEFLLEPDGAFHFLEVNTRLQVEHPVTEEAYGVDLVDAQFALALGEWPASLPAPAAPEEFEPLVPSGAVIEARVLAESPREGFAPSPGRIRRYRPPPGVRVDSGVEAGSAAPPGFDSLLFKAIRRAVSLDEAADALAAALDEAVVHGVETNLPLLAAILRHGDFRDGRAHTGWVEEKVGELAQETFPAWAKELLERPRVGRRSSRRPPGGRRVRAPGCFAGSGRRKGSSPGSGRAAGPARRCSTLREATRRSGSWPPGRARTAWPGSRRRRDPAADARGGAAEGGERLRRGRSARPARRQAAAHP